MSTLNLYLSTPDLKMHILARTRPTINLRSQQPSFLKQSSVCVTFLLILYSPASVSRRRCRQFMRSACFELEKITVANGKSWSILQAEGISTTALEITTLLDTNMSSRILEISLNNSTVPIESVHVCSPQWHCNKWKISCCLFLWKFKIRNFQKLTTRLTLEDKI